ncbi:hypothetical protein JMN32_20725 [Fulvivirga sp. 29W222]|uniref:Aminoglycoside phosphotransferase domain-containing protein n=1 Tax=Fulvivirga marina TaxID=2494733 RepID=A0A937FYZ5_9BACT|nr:hypothetical protein [Fulvivirga marina]MBL6448749.1 hypothetical protein [Fulvivirga marina]
MDKVRFLSRPESYAHTQEVLVRETHMSFVFLTDDHVYKLKKPVCYDFLNFSTLEARHKYCREEVRVNKVLAPDVYLGVVAMRFDGEHLSLGSKGVLVDWLVKMRRLPDEYMLDNLLNNGRVPMPWIQKAAEKLTNFYLSTSPVCMSGHQYREMIKEKVEIDINNLLSQEFGLYKPQIMGIGIDLLRFLMHFSFLFDLRVSEGRVKECHGDLRPEHICLFPEPLMIDRIEFNENLRLMDIAEELSFLTLECEVLGFSETGETFIHFYRLKSKDDIPEELIHFYKAKRALLRAWLCIHHLLEKVYSDQEIKWRGKCENYLNIASDYCEKMFNSTTYKRNESHE